MQNSPAKWQSQKLPIPCTNTSDINLQLLHVWNAINTTEPLSWRKLRTHWTANQRYHPSTNKTCISLLCSLDVKGDRKLCCWPVRHAAHRFTRWHDRNIRACDKTKFMLKNLLQHETALTCLKAFCSRHYYISARRWLNMLQHCCDAMNAEFADHGLTGASEFCWTTRPAASPSLLHTIITDIK